jgi:hypothetical protein
MPLAKIMRIEYTIPFHKIEPVNISVIGIEKPIEAWKYKVSHGLWQQYIRFCGSVQMLHEVKYSSLLTKDDWGPLVNWN